MVYKRLGDRGPASSRVIKVGPSDKAVENELKREQTAA
jgi:hypothetical protein